MYLIHDSGNFFFDIAIQLKPVAMASNVTILMKKKMRVGIRVACGNGHWKQRANKTRLIIAKIIISTIQTNPAHLWQHSITLYIPVCLLGVIGIEGDDVGDETIGSIYGGGRGDVSSLFSIIEGSKDEYSGGESSNIVE